MADQTSNSRRVMRLAILAIALFASPVVAQSLALGAPFQDGMVIQRDQSVPVWGTTVAGARVTVKLGDASESAVADASGQWQVELPPSAAVDTASFEVEAGAERLALADVAIGDVFLCSGQSNMEWIMAKTALLDRERKDPIDARLRLLKVERAASPVPLPAFAPSTRWRPGTDDPASFSSVCLLFGRAIAREQHVVVGLVSSSYGGSPIESWMNRSAMIRAGGMVDRVAMLDAYAADPIAAGAKYGSENKALWNRQNSHFQRRMGFANLYNGMIAPLGPMRLAAVLWYQGENNANGSDTRAEYRAKLEGMMSGWREQFGKDLPFIVFQLSSYGPLASEAGPSSWAEIREAQREATDNDPRAALVVTIDVGERLDIHPPLKKPIAIRAAKASRALVYGKHRASTGPRAVAARMVDRQVSVTIEGANNGLMAASWGRPGPFQLCEARDGLCVYADAQFEPGGIAVIVPDEIEPRLLRYCWATAPLCNVFDKNEQPLGPFELRIAEFKR